jgi:DNA repair protein RadC
MPEQNRNISIKQWAEDDRPREKLLLKGRSSLSDAELLAILIGTGNRKETAVDLAKKILALANNNLNGLAKLTLNDLQKIKGIGEAKAITIAAALELGRRRKEESIIENPIIKTSRNAFDFFYPLLADLDTEEFWVLLLTRKHSVIKPVRISIGGVHATVVDIKVIARQAIENLCSSMVLCHNHPSGNLSPSEHDIKITRQLQQALQIIDVSLIDHIIIGGNNYYSFADEGKL